MLIILDVIHANMEEMIISYVLNALLVIRMSYALNALIIIRYDLILCFYFKFKF